MSDSPRQGNSPGPSGRGAAPATSAQILRQVVVILVVAAIWSALLVGYLALTRTSEEPSPAATATQPAVPEVGVTQPLPGSAAPEDAQISFSADVLPIFESRCVRCHGGASPVAGLSLSSYSDVIAGSGSGPVVMPGSAADSSLVQVIVTGRMPRGAAKLSDAEIQTISDWVDAGAPDN